MAKVTDKTDFRTPEGFAAWKEACGFEYWADAFEALSVKRRTGWRWKAEGLPRGSSGEITARLMREILRRKTRRH